MKLMKTARLIGLEGDRRTSFKTNHGKINYKRMEWIKQA